MKNSPKITVVGLGYVGTSLCALLAYKYQIVAIDIDQKKIDQINSRISPIKDNEISKYLKNKKLKLKGTLNKLEAYKDSEYVIICAPTNFSNAKKEFDTKIIEKIIKEILSLNKNTTIIIKSTVPIGFTNRMRLKFNNQNIFFSPEFLREGKALYDNLFPSRIIIGGKNKFAKNFVKIIKSCAKIKNIKAIYTGSLEAEAVKLFVNSYLALRVAFFNELDSFSEKNNLNSEDIIKGISLDKRVGDYYNNPSFGYGGYCLPKDTKQLKSNLAGSPNEIITAIINSNKKRKSFISKNIVKLKFKRVGIYRLIMKSKSDNFRESSIISIIKKLKKNKIKLSIYEPMIKDDKIFGVKIVKNLKSFKSNCDLIVANRVDKSLKDSASKVYTRDIFRNN